MNRRSLYLAAVAAAAVPGLRPVRVEEVADRTGERFRVVFVEDDERRRWVVRLPGDAVAAALQDESAGLVHLLGPRVPFDVPQPEGVVGLRDGRRAVVYPLIAGEKISFAALPPGPGLADVLGTTIAAVHDLDRRLFEEADLPDYDATELRTRRQVDLDRAAGTGLVPTGLLNRWERMLDDVSWWRFAPTPVHGRLDDSHVLFDFGAAEDAAGGRIAGITSWENAHIGDPADDLAELLRKAPPEAFERVLAAYTQARSEPADPHLVDRCRLLGEMRLLSDLLTARNLGDRAHVTAATTALRDLDDEVSAPGTSGNRSNTVADRLPLDFEPDPVEEDWYRAGSAPMPPEAGTQAQAPERDGDQSDEHEGGGVDVADRDRAESVRPPSDEIAAGDAGVRDARQEDADRRVRPSHDETQDDTPVTAGARPAGAPDHAGRPTARPAVTFDDEDEDTPSGTGPAAHPPLDDATRVTQPFQSQPRERDTVDASTRGAPAAVRRPSVTFDDAVEVDAGGAVREAASAPGASAPDRGRRPGADGADEVPLGDGPAVYRLERPASTSPRVVEGTPRDAEQVPDGVAGLDGVAGPDGRPGRPGRRHR